MSYACHTCRDTGHVTDPGRFYSDRTITSRCPDCAPPRMTLAEWEAQSQAEWEAERLGWEKEVKEDAE